MGLIRVSDETEQRIKEIKGAKSVGAAVDDLLTKNDIAARLDKLAAYLEDKFAELKHSIEDTTIDRVATSRRPAGKTSITDWDIMYNIIFEISSQSDWVDPAVYDTFMNSDVAQEYSYYIQDNQIRYSWRGADYPIVNLNPAITNFLTEKGVL